MMGMASGVRTAVLPKRYRTWILYNGNDEVIGFGSFEEVADMSGLSLATVEHMTFPSHRGRNGYVMCEVKEE